MELKMAEASVWVKAVNELPDSWHLAAARYIYTKTPVSDPELDIINGYDFIIEWLKPIGQVFVLTEDELKEILAEAFDTGAVWEYDKHFGKVPPISKSKKQFIESITK